METKAGSGPWTRIKVLITFRTMVSSLKQTEQVVFLGTTRKWVQGGQNILQAFKGNWITPSSTLTTGHKDYIPAWFKGLVSFAAAVGFFNAAGFQASLVGVSQDFLDPPRSLWSI